MWGLADDSVTRLNKNEDLALKLALKLRDLSELHWARNFMRWKWEFQRCQHRSRRLLRSPLTCRISGLIHGVWGLCTAVLVLIGAWVSRVEESKLICKVGFIYIFIYWYVFLLASLSVMTSQQRNSYFVQFCQQYKKFTENPQKIKQKQWIIVKEQREMILDVFWQYLRCSSSTWSGVPRVLYSTMSAPRGRKPSFAW